MDTVMLVALPGIVGGLLIAWIAIRLGPGRRPNDLREVADGVPETDIRRDFLAHDLINMSRVPVSGIGGLGLVAVSLVVAWFLPLVWQALVFSLVAGAVLGVLMILHRRQIGPMTPADPDDGAPITLSIEHPRTPVDTPGPHDWPRRRLRAIVVRTSGLSS